MQRLTYPCTYCRREVTRNTGGYVRTLEGVGGWPTGVWACHACRDRLGLAQLRFIR
jgi:hypothetical protein